MDGEKNKMAFKVKSYKGWKIKQLKSGKGKGLIYAEKKGTSFGILGGENTVKEMLYVLDSWRKR